MRSFWERLYCLQKLIIDIKWIELDFPCLVVLLYSFSTYLWKHCIQSAFPCVAASTKIFQEQSFIVIVHSNSESRKRYIDYTTMRYSKKPTDLFEQYILMGLVLPMKHTTHFIHSRVSVNLFICFVFGRAYWFWKGTSKACLPGLFTAGPIVHSCQPSTCFGTSCPALCFGCWFR